MKNSFDRKTFMRERHAFAKEQKSFFEKEFGETDLKYSDFLKSDSPLSNQLVTYDVSFQLSYRGRHGHLDINRQTFQVTGFRGDESQIYNNTMNLVLDSKGKMTNNNFSPNTLTAIEDNIVIKINPRGMEESTRKPSREEIEKVIGSRFTISGLDKDMGIKNKAGTTGKMNLDIRHFL